MRTIVFSAAYDQNIKRLLVESGFDDAFEEVVSNVLVEVEFARPGEVFESAKDSVPAARETKGPRGSRADPERIPSGSRADPERIPRGRRPRAGE
jgi:hypothetical protein